jgi:DnaJ-domain-containing protein 1
MFQSTNNVQRALVNLHLIDGTRQIASIRLPLSGKLNEAMNNADGFLDVITGDGQQQFIAKHAIQKAETIDPPKARLNQQRRDSDNKYFDPHAVLGITNTTGKDEMRQAYINLVKSYHPDRFANLDLPAEMKDYAAAMQARINMAYEQLKD